MSQDQKQITNAEDASKQGIPTSLDDIFSFGEENATIADVIKLLVGGESKDELAIIQRTNITRKESSVISEALVIAKYGLILDDEDMKPRSDWEIPILRDLVKNILRSRTSLDGKSIDKVVEAIQNIKMRTEVQKTQTLGQM